VTCLFSLTWIILWWRAPNELPIDKQHIAVVCMHFHNSSFAFNFSTSIFLLHCYNCQKQTQHTCFTRVKLWWYNSWCTFDPQLCDVPIVLVLHVLTVFPSFALVDNAIVSRHYDSQNNDYLDNVCKTLALSRNTMLGNTLPSKRPCFRVASTHMWLRVIQICAMSQASCCLLDVVAVFPSIVVIDVTIVLQYYTIAKPMTTSIMLAKQWQHQG